MTLDRAAIERVRLGPAQRGQKHLLQVGVKHRPVGRGGDAHGADNALEPERAQDGDPLPATTWGRAQGALTARAPAMKAGQVGQSATFIEEDQALGRDGRHGGPPGPRAWASAASPCSLARRLLFLARQAQAPEGSAEGPGVNPHPGLLDQLIPVFDQAQMVVVGYQAAQRRFAFLADRGLGAAAHRLGLEPAFSLRHLDPAVDGRAADQKALGDRLTRLATLQHRRDHAAAQITGIGSGHGSPPASSLP
jgi:hypothetical protein